ncbi:MAG TPA: hypothetical protein VI072_31900 [Polyangiaceae bacterium]
MTSVARRAAALMGAASAASALLAGAELRAQPSVWEEARDARSRRAYQAFVSAERMQEHARDSFGDPRLQRDFTLTASALLELAGGAELGDARLSYMLGDLLLDPLLTVNRSRDAQRLLTLALEQAPSSPLAAHGWFNLAIASAKLKQPKQEHVAYTRALELEHDPDMRATIFSNRAESSMVTGDLRAAIRDYRRAADLAQLPHAQALAHWGLGIALERDGDLPSALNAIRTAQGIKLPSPPYPASHALELPEVFFVPDYDIHYYRALGAMAEARSASEPPARKLALSEAVAAWTEYVRRAEADSTPWLEHARMHRTRCERELAQVERLLRSGPALRRLR